MSVKPLSELQQRFVDAYCGEARGNAAEAVRMAGYKCKTPQSQAAAGGRLLTSVNIQAAIKERTSAVESSRIATIEEIQQVLTEIIRDGVVEPQHRISASKELAKMQGAYIDRKEIKHEGIPQTVFVLPSNGREGGGGSDT